MVLSYYKKREPRNRTYDIQPSSRPCPAGRGHDPGSITRHLIQFALPLLAGNVFQQLYNMVDTWVVGNFVSNEAFSAVGTVGPIINMLIGFFMGLSSGAGVVISQYYGAHRPEKVRDTVHTAMVLTLVLCAVFTALGLALIPAMLDLMNTPAEVLPESTAYLSIYFSGITGLLIYNMGSGILRAVGDSRRPFYFLVVSAVLNTGLDLLFVIRFHMGVAGVAWATIIAQAVSAVLVLAVMMRTDSCVRVELRRLRVHWDMLKKIVRVGIPAALQMAVTRLFQRVRPVLYQPFRRGLHVRLDGVYQDRSADVPAHAVPGPVRHHLCGAEPGRTATPPVPSRASAGRWGSPWR